MVSLSAFEENYCARNPVFGSRYCLKNTNVWTQIDIFDSVYVSWFSDCLPRFPLKYHSKDTIGKIENRAEGSIKRQLVKKWQELSGINK